MDTFQIYLDMATTKRPEAQTMCILHCSGVTPLYHWSLATGNYQWPVDSPHNSTVMWKVLPCHDVLMSWDVLHVIDTNTRSVSLQSWFTHGFSDTRVTVLQPYVTYTWSEKVWEYKVLWLIPNLSGYWRKLSLFATVATLGNVLYLHNNYSAYN